MRRLGFECGLSTRPADEPVALANPVALLFQLVCPGLGGTQIATGSASAEIEAARLLYLAPVRETMAAIASGETVTPAFKAKARRDASFAAQLALGAVQRLFNQAGGGALFTSSAMQRQFRDVVAAAAHHAINWDNAAGDYGKLLLGQ